MSKIEFVEVVEKEETIDRAVNKFFEKEPPEVISKEKLIDSINDELDVCKMRIERLIERLYDEA